MNRRTVETEAYLGHTGEWLYEGFTAWQWGAIAADKDELGKRQAADEAYDISAWLQDLDKHRAPGARRPQRRQQ